MNNGVTKISKLKCIINGPLLPFHVQITSSIKENEQDKSISDKLRRMRDYAYRKVGERFSAIYVFGEAIPLLSDAAQKKCVMIKEAMSKAELDDIIKPSQSVFNGSKFVPEGKYYIGSEDLVAMLDYVHDNPLDEEQLARLEELMEQYFPGYMDLMYGLRVISN